MAFERYQQSRMSMQPADYTVKLLLIGDSGVGKSCLLTKFSEDTFSPAHISTIGIDFKIKHVQMKGKRVKLQIWDTAGQERFRTITTAYYRGAHGIAMVYDVTNPESFANITTWLGQIERNAADNVVRVLVGNKADMVDRRLVDREDGKRLAAQYGLPFFETSAKSGADVEEVFMHLAETIVKQRMEDQAVEESSGKSIVISNPKLAQESCSKKCSN